MSLEMKSVQVRLPSDVYEALRVVSCAQGKDLGKCARYILTEALMGKVYSIRVALDRFNKSDKAR